MITIFTAVREGAWSMASITAVAGPTLETRAHLSIAVRDTAKQMHHATTPPAWQLSGFASNVRYVERPEKIRLNAVQAGLGRPEATRAALIPIRKSAAWWELTQDERRHIFEAKSRHIAGSMKYLPAIARQLYHSRDLGEPFDFLTWFEFAPEHEAAFGDLLGMLRGTEEWSYVEREVEVRLARHDGE